MFISLKSCFALLSFVLLSTTFIGCAQTPSNQGLAGPPSFLPRSMVLAGQPPNAPPEVMRQQMEQQQQTPSHLASHSMHGETSASPASYRSPYFPSGPATSSAGGGCKFG